MLSASSRLLLCGLWLVVVCCGQVRAFSSVNVPLDNWSYAALDKLEGFGLIQSALHGTRPFSRLEMARLIHEAQVAIRMNEIRLPPLAAELLQDLEREFREELALTGKRTAILQKSFLKPLKDVELRYVYSQGEPRQFLNVRKGEPGIRQYPDSTQGIRATEGTPLVANNEGLVYSEQSNVSLRFSTMLGYRDFFSAYLEPVFLARQHTVGFDGTGSKVDLLKGYGMLTFWNTQLEGGRDSMWWGQGAHGDLLLTNNAYPLDLVKFSNPEPTLLPWLFRYLGPFKYTAFVAPLTGYENPADPWLGGLRFNFKPHPLFEMGLSTTFMFNGEGMPRFNPFDLFKFFVGRSPLFANQLAAFDLRLRLPFLRDAQFYLEYGGEDSGGWSPQYPSEVILEDNAWLFGIHFPRLTCDGRADLRVEYTWNAHRIDETPAMWYAHSEYRSGYTYNNLIMGHHLGPDAEDLFARVTYYLTNRVQLGLDYDRMVRGKTLSPVEERVNQYGADLTLNLCRKDLMLITRYAFQTVDNYNMQLGNNRGNSLFETVLKLQF